MEEAELAKRMLRAAADATAERGYANVSVADILERGRLAKPST
jgi:AcrR family transcriptional regulator